MHIIIYIIINILMWTVTQIIICKILVDSIGLVYNVYHEKRRNCRFRKPRSGSELGRGKVRNSVKENLKRTAGKIRNRYGNRFRTVYYESWVDVVTWLDCRCGKTGVVKFAIFFFYLHKRIKIGRYDSFHYGKTRLCDR